MSYGDSPNWLTRSFQGILGLLGVYAAVRLLPRLLRLLTRRFIFGLIGEIVLVTLGLFLTRRATRPPRNNGAPQQEPEGTTS